MIIVLEADITSQQRQVLAQFLAQHNLRVHEIVGTRQSVLGATGGANVRTEELAALPGVQEIIPISKPWVSRELQKADSVYQIAWDSEVSKEPGFSRPSSVRLPRLPVGGQRLGLCAEIPLPALTAGNSETLLRAYSNALLQLREAGISIFRYRPLTAAGLLRYVHDPEGLQQVNLQRLQFVRQLKQRVEMPLLIQVSSLSQLSELARTADILQVEAQQMRNTELLAELSRWQKPLILQRAADASLEEFLLAAEFALSSPGGPKSPDARLKEVILAETFMPNPARAGSRMMDFANIHLLQQLSHLPVFVNLSSSFGFPEMLAFGGLSEETEGPATLLASASFPLAQGGAAELNALALAAAAAGAQGIELVLNPDSVLRQFLPHSASLHYSGGDFGCGELLAEWHEALYLLEQLKQMGGLLQREIVLLPTLAAGAKNEVNSGSSSGQSPLIVAFQGEPGAYSEQALRQFFYSENAKAVFPSQRFGRLESLPCASFRQIFEAVQSGRALFATVPLENSLAGSIMENYDLLLEYPDLCICGETRLRVSHMLIAAKGSKLEQIRVVRSHPQALAQSSHFLEQHQLQALANFDTAGSVRQLKERAEPHVAAIASALAAEIYDMEILARAIESNPHNYTRFAIVSRCDSELLQAQATDAQRQNSGEGRGKGPKWGDKWSLCLRLRNFSGSLATALEIFQKYRLDLTKLESRPIMGQPWSYRFYLDTLISGELDQEDREQEFFRDLERISEEYRVIGRYWENLK